jgi:hypothetical protein
MNFLIYLIPLFTILILSACNKSIDQTKNKSNTNHSSKIAEVKNHSYPDISYSTIQEQADSLISFYLKALESSGTEKKGYDSLFFCSFPNSYKGMNALFGVDSNLQEGPLYYSMIYDNSYESKAIKSNIIGYFSELTTIPKHEYVTKYITINLDGIAKGDHLNDAFGLYHVVKENPAFFCKVLAEYSDAQIESVFKFLLDYPQPNDAKNAYVYKQLQPLLSNQNKRISQLFERAYSSVQ